MIGAGFSSLNIIEGCKLITKVAEGYDSISDVNAAKVSAKDCARGIALLGVEIIPVLFGLIKRGVAKYNGKEISVGGKTGNTPVKENAGVNSGTQRPRTVKDILIDAGYKDENIINNPEYGEKIEQLRLLYSDEDIISNIKNMKTTGKKSIGFILDNMKSKMSAKGGQTSFENYDTSKGTPHQNGNWAEHISFEDYINNPKLKEAGYDLRRVGLAAPDSPNETLRKGIDGIYENVSPNAKIKFVIDESKYNTAGLSKLTNGDKQGSMPWILGGDRLKDYTNGDRKLLKEITDAISNKKLEVVRTKVLPGGKIIRNRLDVDGNVLGTWP